MNGELFVMVVTSRTGDFHPFDAEVSRLPIHDDRVSDGDLLRLTDRVVKRVMRDVARPHAPAAPDGQAWSLWRSPSDDGLVLWFHSDNESGLRLTRAQAKELGEALIHG